MSAPRGSDEERMERFVRFMDWEIAAGAGFVSFLLLSGLWLWISEALAKWLVLPTIGVSVAVFVWTLKRWSQRTTR